MYNEDFYERLKKGESPEDILKSYQTAIEEAQARIQKEDKRSGMRKIVEALIEFMTANYSGVIIENISEEEMEEIVDILLSALESSFRYKKPVVKEKKEAVKPIKRSDDEILRSFINSIMSI